MKTITWAAACGALLWTVGAGCGTRGKTDPSPPAPNDGVFAVQLESNTVAGLPVCSSALRGQTAFVSSPPSLYWCNGGAWIPLPCTEGLSGDVAYASTTRTLWACAGGAWTPVAPPTRVSVTELAAGTTCPAGGLEIQTWVDSNGNGVMDPGEVLDTAYVCNGTGNGSDPPGTSCTSDRQCASGSCADGVCCDDPCAGNCRSCNLPGHVGTCTDVPDGQDPRRACQISAGGAPDYCGGTCIAGQCTFPEVGTRCGVCAACDGTGRCIETPADDDRCGVVQCSGLDSACRIYQDLVAGRCGSLGVCKTPNDPATCVFYTDIPHCDGGV